MIDLFAIFSKGGLVLWCFQGTSQFLTPSINALIRDVFLLERGSVSVYNHQNVTMKFKLDNEFELIYLVLYQSVVQLAYVDKLLDDVHIKFRDLYKNVLLDRQHLHTLCGTNYFDDEFSEIFQSALMNAQETLKFVEPKAMRKYEDSKKSEKTVASMLIKPAAVNQASSKQKQQKESAKEQNDKKQDGNKENVAVDNTVVTPSDEKQPGVDETLKKREEFFNKQRTTKSAPKQASKIPAADKKKHVKQGRRWDSAEDDPQKIIDYSDPVSASSALENTEEQEFFKIQKKIVGQRHGELPGIEENESGDDDIDYLDDDIDDSKEKQKTNAAPNKSKSTGGFSVFSAFKSLVGSKKLTLADVEPALEKMKEHLIAKNVAADIADKVCQSLAVKLDGKVIGTFSGVAGTVKESLRESLVQLLSPKRRVDILRDIMEAKKQKRPFCITFCGVNGVGKSTNLAKITFWLNENNYKVLIAACDTFRAGAVEQLRTHTRHLNALHPGLVQLYEQGYGKDAAGVAAQAISYAAENGHDVVLVDTAGRMQDNEPLMRALAKLIRVNTPDLVLFVGEALVGNEAVDQLTKFNQALADHAAAGQAARLIDGIVLTKFDTIDDKVGAAISMTYITGQPIVFVGTGQTYGDLKNLNANAVVHALLK